MRAAGQGTVGECAFCGITMVHVEASVHCDDCGDVHAVCHACAADMTEADEGYALVA